MPTFFCWLRRPDGVWGAAHRPFLIERDQAVPINRLTDRECRAAVCPSHLKARKLPDGHGMYLLVKPSGAKAWRMAFRVKGARTDRQLRAVPAGEPCRFPRVTVYHLQSLRDFSVLPLGQDKASL